MATSKDNRSFVLKGIDDVVYEERPIPNGPLVLDSDLGAFSLQLESTRSSSRSRRLVCRRSSHPHLYLKLTTTPPRHLWLGCSLKCSLQWVWFSVLRQSVQVHYLAHGRIGEKSLHPNGLVSSFSSQVITLSKNLWFWVMRARESSSKVAFSPFKRTLPLNQVPIQLVRA